MLHSIRSRLTYANVVSTIALMAVVAGGTAYAAGKITSADIAKNAVLSKHIKNGQVRKADLAQPGPFRLVGKAGQPAFKNGGAGDCIWSNIHQSTPPQRPFNPAGFYKDPFGTVHLTGGVMSVNGTGGDATCDDTQDAFVFRLPSGYRPPKIVAFAPAGGGGTGLVLIVGVKNVTIGPSTLPAGMVAVSASLPTSVTFDGIDFRAAGPGNGIKPGPRGVHLSTKQLRSLLHPGG